jgi:hypothetical protein
MNPPRRAAVRTADHRTAAEELAEYLHGVAGVAKSEYGLELEVAAMVRSDIDDARTLGCAVVRLESLRALAAAHRLHRAAGMEQRLGEAAQERA